MNRNALELIKNLEEALSVAIEAAEELANQEPKLQQLLNAYMIPHLESWLEGDQIGNCEDCRERLEDEDDE